MHYMQRGFHKSQSIHMNTKHKHILVLIALAPEDKSKNESEESTFIKMHKFKPAYRKKLAFKRRKNRMETLGKCKKNIAVFYFNQFKILRTFVADVMVLFYMQYERIDHPSPKRRQKPIVC